MKALWVVFRDQNGKELCAYTVKGTFRGELAATKELLASERGIPAEDISVTVETTAQIEKSKK